MIPYLDLHTINAPYEADIKQALLDVVDSGWYLFGQKVSPSAESEMWSDMSEEALIPLSISCEDATMVHYLM